MRRWLAPQPRGHGRHGRGLCGGRGPGEGHEVLLLPGEAEGLGEGDGGVGHVQPLLHATGHTRHGARHAGETTRGSSR